MLPPHFQSIPERNTESTSFEYLLQGRTYFNRVACIYIYIYIYGMWLTAMAKLGYMDDGNRIIENRLFNLLCI